MLTVIAAAIRTDDGRVWSISPPARHHDVIKLIRESDTLSSVGGEHQGFMLSDGRFASRKVSLAVARCAGQLKDDRAICATLTSEDLW